MINYKIIQISTPLCNQAELSIINVALGALRALMVAESGDLQPVATGRI